MCYVILRYHSLVTVCFHNTDANHDPPEIHRIIPGYGTAHGGEQIVIVGTRMHTGKLCSTN